MVEFGHLSLCLALSGFLFISASAGEAGEVIGHVAATSDAAVGVLDGDTTRLKSGDPVFRDEVVETGPQSSPASYSWTAPSSRWALRRR